MGTAISNVGSCSTTESAPPPLLLPPCLTSSATYPQSWVELIREVKNPAPVMRPRRPWKRRQPEEEEWKTLKEDRCEVHGGGGMGGLEGRGDSRG